MKSHYKGPGHIAIRTEDISESLNFYKILGGEILKEDSLPGGKKLALVSFGGITLEFIEAPDQPPMSDGSITHFAIYVDDVDLVASTLRDAGINSFLTSEKVHMPTLFGGLENWFFTGPSGEQIELLKML